MTTTADDRVADRQGRLHIGFLRRAAIGLAVALVGLTAATGPASAAASTDGTSNTIQFVAPRLTYILNNTMISGLVAGSAYSLSYEEIK